MRYLMLLVFMTLPAMVRAQGLQEMTVRLANLRSEIETLNVEIDGMKKDHQGRIDSLMQRRLELEGERLKETGRKVQVETQLDSLRKRASRLAARSGQDSKRLLDLIASSRFYLEKATPIQIAERMKELSSIEADVKSGEVSLESCVVSLWKWLDNELRLSLDARIASQAIRVAGTETDVNAEVLSLGSAAVLFADANGRFGRAVRERDGWKYRYFETEREQSMAQVAFEAARKKKSPGFLEIPGLTVTR